MGISGFHKQKETRYVTEEAFKENSSKQVEGVTTVLGVLKGSTA